ncbi:hypothetical protein BH24ACT15_BH24ACT15_18010 [soil metagenome]
MDIGTWVRAGGFVGIVSKIEPGPDGEPETLVVFNHGDRQIIRATLGAVQALPTGRVRVAVRHEVDVPHGLSEEALSRWLAALIDPVLRERARESLEEAGLDRGPFRDEPTIEVTEVGS